MRRWENGSDGSVSSSSTGTDSELDGQDYSMGMRLGLSSIKRRGTPFRPYLNRIYEMVCDRYTLERNDERCAVATQL